jgi:hypothetical protein
MSSYKIPVELFEKYFLKIYQFVLMHHNFDRREIRKRSVEYNGVFVSYSRFEIARIFDFMMDRIETYPTQKEQLDNPYSDVLVILVNYLQQIKQEDYLPKKRLERLYELSK